MASITDVVITGVGVVSPLGVGVEAYWRAMRRGESGVRRLEAFTDSPLATPIGGIVPEFEAKQYIRPRKSIKIMSREIQMAVAAAALAIDDANLDAGDVDPDRWGVTAGCDFLYCPLEDLMQPVAACMEDGAFHFERWGPQGMSQLFPLWMLKYLPNMASCHIGIAHDARGPNNSLTLGEVSSLLAIMESVAVIQRGGADVMFSGGVGSRLNPTPMMFRGDANLSHRCDDPEAACRPFDADRDGMVNAEGSAIFILESRAHAERRGARILARVAAGCSRFAPVLEDPRSGQRAIEQTIRGACSAAQLSPAQVGHVNANGFSTIEHDIHEAAAIRSTLGDVPVTAPKSFMGNLSAGTGAVEMAASVQALQQASIPPTRNYGRPDPRCPVQVNTDPDAAASHPTALLLNQSSTGQAVAVLLVKD